MKIKRKKGKKGEKVIKGLEKCKTGYGRWECCWCVLFRKLFYSENLPAVLLIGKLVNQIFRGSLLESLLLKKSWLMFGFFKSTLTKLDGFFLKNKSLVKSLLCKELNSFIFRIAIIGKLIICTSLIWISSFSLYNSIFFTLMTLR